MAIELAAARSRSMSPDDLLTRLGDRFRLLRGAGRGGDARHQTLRATVGWSYQLLLDEERILFDRLSVFAGGFDVAAAEEVCADASVAKDDVLDLLASLVDKSMVVAERAPGGSRYRLLETLREYGEERLVERGEVGSTRDRHLRRYVDVAASADELWGSARQLDADAIFDREWANIRAAHGWAVATEDLVAADALVAATAQHAFIRRNREHGEWAERTLILGNADRHPHPTTYGWACHWAFHTGAFDRSVELAHSGIRVAPAPDHPDTIWCWTYLAAALGRVRPRQRSERCGAAQPACSLHRDDGTGRACPGAGSADRHRSRHRPGPGDRGPRLVHRARRGPRRPLAARHGEPLPGHALPGSGPIRSAGRTRVVPPRLRPCP